MIKVCVASKNTVANDVRTLTEAKIIAEAGLNVTVVGLLGRNQPEYERRDGFGIRRVQTTLGLAPAFRHRIYLPVYRRLPPRLQRTARTIWNIVVPGLRWVDRRLKGVTTYLRLSQAMISERAHYYHAHHPALLMFLTLLTAALLRRRFIRDYRDAIVLEYPRTLQSGYHEQKSLWDKPLYIGVKDRIEATVRLIPPGACSILDVGCGDGRITNRLTNLTDARVVGIDVSEEALKRVQTEAIHGSVDNIPFADQMFDLVLATELVEHLPSPTYQEALKEIKRVARRWILIGVPWREQLSLAQARCIRCKTSFHLNYHYRSFDERRLRRLFSPDFGLVTLVWAGKERRSYVPLLLWLRRHLGGGWLRTPTTVCPTCQTHLCPAEFPERTAISRFCDERNESLRRRTPAEKSHVIALYQRSRSRCISP